MMPSPSDTISPVSSASGMNSSGLSSPRDRVAPAGERLDAAPPSLAEPEDRLIVHLQLAALDRVAQLGLVAQPFAQPRSQAIVVDLAPARPQPARRGGRSVGGTDELIGVHRRIRECDPDAGGEEELDAIARDRDLDRRA